MAKSKVPETPLEVQFFKDLDEALSLCDAEQGLDLPDFTQKWVNKNEAKCKKEATQLFYMALYKKGRDHIKRPLGEQAFLPGLEYLKDLVPVAISVPTEEGKRYWPLNRATVAQARGAYTALRQAIMADARRADGILVLIHHAEERGAGPDDPLLLEPEEDPDLPPEAPGPELRPDV